MRSWSGRGRRKWRRKWAARLLRLSAIIVLDTKKTAFYSWLKRVKEKKNNVNTHHVTAESLARDALPQGREPILYENYDRISERSEVKLYRVKFFSFTNFFNPLERWACVSGVIFELSLERKTLCQTWSRIVLGALLRVRFSSLPQVIRRRFVDEQYTFFLLNFVVY